MTHLMPKTNLEFSLLKIDFINYKKYKSLIYQLVA